MATIFLQHRIDNYDTWKPVYDGDAERRNDAGLTEIGVYRKAGDEHLEL